MKRQGSSAGRALKLAAAVLLVSVCVFASLSLTGCGNSENSAIVGEWTPATVSIHGTTISYSDLDTEGREFAIHFYPDGKCKMIIGGISNEGTYTFNETSVDIQYAGKSQRLSYDRGILTLKLDYNNQTTSYMFTKVAK